MPPVMHPKLLPPEVMSDPARKAEAEVYKALRRTLPDGFHVFYACNWHDPKGSRSADGETDFLVAHERLGYAVLEVKGGVIARDANTHLWYSRDGVGDYHRIKDPMEQAKQAKHVILRKLKDAANGRMGHIRTKHAVVFPGSEKPASGQLGADMPMNIMMDIGDMPELGKKVAKMMCEQHPEGNEYSPLGADGIRALEQLFSQGFVLNVSLRTRLRSCEFKIVEATEQQKKLLRFIEHNRKVLISGGAGTGKTALALEKAKLLSQAGHSVLFLCFNMPLGKYLRKVLNNVDGIDVSNFHQFCLKAAKDTGTSVPVKGSDEIAWDELPKMLVDILGRHPEQFRYDAIIIDEGQDFGIDWLDAIHTCLREPEAGYWYFFYDDGQKIYAKNVDGFHRFADTSFCLVENVRNSKPIFAGSKAFYQGGRLEALGPDGDTIKWISTEEQDPARKLEKMLHRLVRKERIEESEIAVLSAKSHRHYDRIAVNGYTFRKAEEANSQGIVLDSIYRFKGLERQVVILMDLSPALEEDKKALLYVGFSRAKSLLIIIDSPATITKLKGYVESAGAEAE